MPKACGPCSLCCKFLNVPGMAPDMIWCPHAKPGSRGGGCTIHDHRPADCLGFDCFWRAESWPDKLRPDLCHVMFEALPNVRTILATVDPEWPFAWTEDLVVLTIGKLIRKGRPVVVYVKGKPPVYGLPPGVTKADVHRDVHAVVSNFAPNLKGSGNDGAELHA